jgi:DNA-binding CsgD family transcriptional regulator
LRQKIGHVLPSGSSGMPELSPRESEIAHLICAGKQNKEIAWLTGLSVHTIENHLKRIYRKFHIQNRAALVSKMRSQAH